MKYEAILFDLDGTLLDTLQDIADSLNHVLTGMGYPARNSEDVRRFVGNGSRRLIERALPENAGREAIDSCLEKYVPYYKTHAQIRTAPYPGVLDLMDELIRRGYKTAVVSNKPDGAVKPMCQTYFPGRVDAAQGEDEKNGIRTKPCPDSTLAAMRALGVTADKCLYVGDSEVDLMTARNADMDCLSVSWGFRSRDQLVESGAQYIADQVSDFIPIMEKMQHDKG